jgi:hypothetical protein
VTDPQVIWWKLIVHFARSLSFPDQVPAVMHVKVRLRLPQAPQPWIVSPPGTTPTACAIHSATAGAGRPLSRKRVSVRRIPVCQTSCRSPGRAELTTTAAV